MTNIEEKGYIYLRTHEAYDIHNAYKLGRTYNIIERDNQYVTGEIIRGHFIDVYEVPHNHTINIEGILQYEFKSYNIRKTGGIEFYNKCIRELIENILNKYIKDKWRKLSQDEINNFERINRDKTEQQENINNIENNPLIKIDDNIEENKQKIDKIIIYEPKTYQNEIINKSVEYFENNDKGLLCLMCGVGKTLISLWITKKIFNNKIKLLIGVPNLLLIEQWIDKIKHIFPSKKILSITQYCSENDIKKELLNYCEDIIVITTYSSSYKLLKVSTEINYIFDMKINDECHHLTASNITDENINKYHKRYIKMLYIPSNKQISLTATLKYITNPSNNEYMTTISNCDEKYFGNIIDNRGVMWSIKNNIICDYKVQIFIMNNINFPDNTYFNPKIDNYNNINIDNNIDYSDNEENDSVDDNENIDKIDKFTQSINNINEEERIKYVIKNKRLFCSAYQALKSIIDKKTHHILIYANNNINAEQINRHIKYIIDNKIIDISNINLYYNYYHSKISNIERCKILSNFDKANYGILICVYCLGEGWDYPKLDAVVFAEYMTSIIRIVQAIFRAGRKNKDEPNKITNILLPILNSSNDINKWIDSDDDDYKKIREVIQQIGIEDYNIIEKINIRQLNIIKTQYNITSTINNITSTTNNNIIDTTNNNIVDDNNINDINILNKLLLRTIDRQFINISYDNAVNILKPCKIINKIDYINYCKKDIRFYGLVNPEEIFKHKFQNWVHYLSIDTTKFYNIDECIAKINEYKNSNPNINKCVSEYDAGLILCNKDCKFPDVNLWTEIYKVNNLSDIIKLSRTKKISIKL